jgi:Zn-dependent protease with chaperone function
MKNRRLVLIYTLTIIAAAAIFLAGPVFAKTTVKQEIDIGQKAAKDIEKQFPLSEHKDWQQEIDKLGKSLIPNVTRKDIPYTFKILKEKVDGKNEVDAFSLPGGPVYMSERLWLLLTKDERVGVLGHEITHVDKRHAIDTMSEMQKRSMWATLVLIVSNAKSNAWNATDLANNLYTLKYSRKRETEADMGAVELTRQAGYSPAGIVTSLKKILRIEKENGGGSLKILSTHPETKDRVEYLTKRCLELGIKPEDLEIKSKDLPDRLGNVVSTTKKANIINVSTTRDLAANETVWIKKALWDDASNSLLPKPVAKGVVKVPGKTAQVTLTMEPGFEFMDIEQGDGVYPRQPDQPKTPQVEPGKPVPTPVIPVKK